jgi:hypothetical protein
MPYSHLTGPFHIRAVGLGPTSRATVRAVTTAIEHEAARAVVRAARLEAAGYVTHVGLQYLAALSAEEERLIHQAPLGERRYQAVVDAYAGLVATTVARMAFDV